MHACGVALRLHMRRLSTFTRMSPISRWYSVVPSDSEWSDIDRHASDSDYSDSEVPFGGIFGGVRSDDEDDEELELGAVDDAEKMKKLQEMGFSMNGLNHDAFDLLDNIHKSVREVSRSPETEEEKNAPDSRGLESFKILLKRDEELDELDREYKRIILGGVSKEDAESVVLGRKGPGHEHLIYKKIQPPPTPLVLEGMRKVDERGISIGVGRRKTSSARVFLKPGTGIVTVNGKDHIDYFETTEHRLESLAGLLYAKQMGKYDVTAFVSGGGKSGQAGAMRVALAWAVLRQDPSTRKFMVEDKLTRPDGRSVERKKFGKPKARKSFAFVKR
jgi:small subunit ribosomal protein S9